MAMFNSYVSLPEGMSCCFFNLLLYACVASLHLIFLHRTGSLVQVLPKILFVQPKSAQAWRKKRASFSSKVNPVVDATLSKTHMRMDIQSVNR
jgi:hypothetical protein